MTPSAATASRCRSASRDGLPYSKGLMARALIAAGVPAERAYELARRLELDLAERGARRSSSSALEELASRCSARRRARSAVAPAAALSRRCRRSTLPILLLVGGATGTGQVDGRDRGRAPARDHARHLDRLHPPDDARVLLAASSCRRSTTRASRRAQRSSTPETGDPDAASASSSRRATCSSASRRRSSARSPRAGRWCSRASTSCPGMCRRDRGRARRPRRARDRERGRAPRRTSTSATSTTGGVRAMDKYLEQLDEIRRIQDAHRRARREDGRAGDRELEPRARDRRA